MPLVQKDYYLSSEALELIERAFPDECSEHNLIEALRNGLRAWILDEKTNQRILILSEMWWQGSREENPELYERSVSFAFSADRALLKMKCGEGIWDWATYNGELQIDKEGLDQLLASAAESDTRVDSYRTGAPGRPSIAHFISVEFNRRFEAGEMLQSLAGEARALYDWARALHSSNAPVPTEHTIENQIRSAYNQAKGQEPTK